MQDQSHQTEVFFTDFTRVTEGDAELDVTDSTNSNGYQALTDGISAPR